MPAGHLQKAHEAIGTSLLLAYDKSNKKARMKWIDFAHVYRPKKGVDGGNCIDTKNHAVHKDRTQSPVTVRGAIAS